jgi:hypothetical protein
MMTKFFEPFPIRLVAFFLPWVLLLLVFELRLARVPNGFVAVREQIEKKSATVENLLVGTSHFYFLNTDDFKAPTGTLAFPGQGLEISCQLIEKYLEQLPNLRHIFFEIAYMSFDFLPTNGAGNYFYRLAFGIPGSDPAISSLLDLRMYSWTAVYGPATALSVLRSDFTSAAPAAELEDPLIPMAESERQRVGKERAAFHEGLLQPENRVRSITMLTRVIERARARGIDFAFVITPTALDYRKHLRPEVHAGNLALMRRFQANYSTGYFDYLADDRFTDADFRDTDHLTPAGARKFASILEADVLANLPIAKRTILAE